MNFPAEKISVCYEQFKIHDFSFDSCECKVVEPLNPLPGRQWVWKAEFFYAFPLFEIEMLKRGYYVCFMSVGNTFGCPDAMKHFDRFYDELTRNFDFSRYPILLGLSRGGLYIYNWAIAHPDCVGALYGDNPVCDFKSWPGAKGVGPGSPDDWKKLMSDYHFLSEKDAMSYPTPMDQVDILLKAGVPLVHAAGVDDEVVPFEENTAVMEKRVAELGGTLTVFRHPGKHHPHGLSDPRPLADWIEAHRIKDEPSNFKEYIKSC